MPADVATAMASVILRMLFSAVRTVCFRRMVVLVDEKRKILPSLTLVIYSHPLIVNHDRELLQRDDADIGHASSPFSRTA